MEVNELTSPPPEHASSLCPPLSSPTHTLSTYTTGGVLDTSAESGVPRLNGAFTVDRLPKQAAIFGL